MIHTNSIGEKFDDSKPNTVHWAMLTLDGTIEYMKFENLKVFAPYYMEPFILPKGRMENNWYGRSEMSHTKGGAMVLAAKFLESEEGQEIKKIFAEKNDNNGKS